MAEARDKLPTNAQGHAALEGRFAIDHDRVIVDWDGGAAAVLGIPAAEAFHRPCYEVVGGTEDLRQTGCGFDCAAWRALQRGHIQASTTILAHSCSGERIRLRCDLTAIPSLPGGALGRVRPAGTQRAAMEHDLAAIATFATKISSLSLREAAEQALDFLLTATTAQAAEMFLAEPEGRGMVLTCHRGRFRSAFAQITRFGPGEGFPGLVLKHGQPVFSDRLAEEPRYLRTRVKAQGFQSYVCIPLLCRTGVAGSLGLGFRQPVSSQERTIALLQWIGAPLGLLVEAELARLRGAVSVRAPSADVDPARRLSSYADAVLRELSSLAGCMSGELHLLPHGRAGPWMSGSRRAMPRCPAMQGGTLADCPCVAYRSANVSPGSGAQATCRCGQLPGFSGTLYCIPLLASPGPVGLVRLLGTSRRQSTPGSDLALLESVTAAAAEAVHALGEGLDRTHAADMAARAVYRHGGGEESASGTEPTSASGHPRLAIRCLGTFEFAVQGRTAVLAEVHRKKALTLFKILLTANGRPQPKETLIEALWPDADPEARSSQFYVLVHELRRLVEDADARQRWRFICNQKDLYYFNRDGSCWVDFVQFRSLVQAARKATAEGEIDGAITAYETAVELYRGDFLQEEPFAEWCWLEREQLRETCLEALKTLADLQGRRGQWDRSIRHLRSALRLDRVREDLHRALMYALWAAGRRDEAIRQYQHCATLLQQELDVAPMPETQDLARLIRTAARPASR
jgi:DNA-binding SARP family transcriptional activator